MSNGQISEDFLQRLRVSLHPLVSFPHTSIAYSIFYKSILSRISQEGVYIHGCSGLPSFHLCRVVQRLSPYIFVACVICKQACSVSSSIESSSSVRIRTCSGPAEGQPLQEGAERLSE